MIRPVSVLPPLRVALMVVAPCTTWLLVRIYPSGRTITPEPAPCWGKTPNTVCTCDSVLMLTTAGSSWSAILANELDNSAGEGGGKGLASGARPKGRAARTPLETSVPIRMPTASVIATTKAGRYLRSFMIM